MKSQSFRFILCIAAGLLLGFNWRFPPNVWWWIGASVAAFIVGYVAFIYWQSWRRYWVVYSKNVRAPVETYADHYGSFINALADLDRRQYRGDFFAVGIVHKGKVILNASREYTAPWVVLFGTQGLTDQHILHGFQKAKKC